jgi:hypothetical protein
VRQGRLNSPLPPTHSFPLSSSKDVKERHELLASEFHIVVPDEWPIYRFQQLSEAAQTRRDKRIEAAEKGLVFTG